MNIEHPTSNIEQPANRWSCGAVGCSVLEVGGWMFLLLATFASSLSAQPATNALPILAPPDGEIPPTFWGAHKTAIFIGAIFLTLLAVFAAWLLLRPKPVPVLPPEKIAREALAGLQREPEDGNILSTVSQILRRYLSQRFNLPGGESTTSEFCQIIETTPRFDAQLAAAIISFLRECDVRKFSPASSTTAVNAVQRALELVAQVETETHRRDARAIAP